MSETVTLTGLRAILDNVASTTVWAAARTSCDARRMARQGLASAAVVVDRRPTLDAVELAVEFCAGAVPTVVLIAEDEPERLFAALRAGARAVLHHGVEPDDLVRAITAVLAGQAFVDPALATFMIDRLRPALPSLHARSSIDLTERERQVLNLVARGLSNSEIADTLTIKERTVKYHVSNVLTKLEARDRLTATVRAYRAGLVD